MQVVRPQVKLITEPDPFKRIEIAGRICYKSESKEGDTAEAFVSRLIKRKHYAVLEHASFVFMVQKFSLYWECEKEKFLNCTEVGWSPNPHNGDNQCHRLLVSGNVRALNECPSGRILLSYLIEAHPEWASLAYSFSPADIGSIIQDGCQNTDAQFIEPSDVSKYLINDYEKRSHTYTTFHNRPRHTGGDDKAQNCKFCS